LGQSLNDYEREGILGISKEGYHASSFSSTSSLKKSSRQRRIETLPFFMRGIGSERIEKILYVVEVWGY